MNFNTVASLTFTSSLSVVNSLYFHHDLLGHCAMRVEQARTIENINSLPLPENHKEEIKNLIQPVEDELHLWIKHFRPLLVGHGDLGKKICWTPLGTINYGKTAGNCIASGEWSNVDAFKLACAGSDPDSIIRLWPLVQEDILLEVSKLSWKMDKSHCTLWLQVWVAYLSDQMKTFFVANRLPKTANCLGYLITFAIKNENVGAARYFMEKQEDKCKLKNNILKLAKMQLTSNLRSFNANTYNFLMYQLTQEDQMHVFNYRPIDYLFRLLTWPLLPFVLPASKLLWSNLDPADKNSFLERVLVKIMQTEEHSSYRNIFKALWLDIPVSDRRWYFSQHTKVIIRHLFKGRLCDHSDTALASLFVKDGKEYVRKMHQLFFDDPEAIMSMAVEDNKCVAFRNVLEKMFNQEDFTKDFCELYDKYTKLYLKRYYGDSMSIDSDPDVVELSDGETESEDEM